MQIPLIFFQFISIPNYNFKRTVGVIIATVFTSEEKIHVFLSKNQEFSHLHVKNGWQVIQTNGV